jgi:potassium efflux system protein
MSVLRHLFLLALITISSVAWADDGSAFALGQELTLSLLQAKIGEAESDAGLDARTRNTLIELYRRAMSNLEAHASDLAIITEYTTNLNLTAGAILELTAETERMERAPVELPLEHPESASRVEIEIALINALSKQTGLEADVLRAQARLDAARQTTSATREELKGVIDEHTLSTARVDTVTLVEELPILKQARRWLAESSELMRGSSFKRLNQHIINLAPRFSYLRVRLDWQKAKLKRQQIVVSTLEPLSAEWRHEDALRQNAMALATQREVTALYPLLAEIAAEDVGTTEKILHFVSAANELVRETTDVKAQVAALNGKYSLVRLKLEAAGRNRAQGRVMLERKDRLPSPRVIEQTLGDKQAQLSDVVLTELTAEERLMDLSDISAFVDRRLESLFNEPPLSDAERGALNWQELARKLAFMANQQRDFNKSLINESVYYSQSLSNFMHAQRRLLNSAKNYHSLLEEQSLWVRNSPDVKLSALFEIPKDRKHYFDTLEFRRVYRGLLELVQSNPLVLVVLLLACLLWYKRAGLRQQLEETNQFLGHPLRDKFTFTLKSLFISILLAAPGPLAVAAFGWGFSLNEYHAGMVAALGPSLRWLAINWFAIALFYQACRVDGLCSRHFQWYETVLYPLRQKLAILMFAYLPLGYVVFFLVALDPSTLDWEYVRIGLVIIFLIVAGFVLDILRSSSPLMLVLSESRADMPIVKLRWLWLAMAVLIPLFLMLLVVLSYVYTATTLAQNLAMSSGLVFLIVLGHQLGMRWLLVTTRRLKFQSLKASQADGSLSAFESESPHFPGRIHYEVPDVDLTELSRDSIKLLNTVILVLGMLGFLLVWYPIFPTLGFLENIQLWSVTKTIQGAEHIDPITLADLFICALIIGASYLLYHNLPAVLKLFFIQVLSLTPGVLYTAINLTLYTIIVVSFFTVANILGFEWSKFQWLVAALGVGIGFGLQDVVANFISGFIILLERPIRVGDLITVGTVEGFVTRIRIRATTVLTFDRQELLVPNKTFISDNLLNWSLSDQITRLIVDVGIAYGSDVNRAMDVMIEVARSDNIVISEPKPFVTFEGFGDNALNLRLLCFIDDIEARIITRSRLHKDINQRLQEEGIEIAFPQMDLHFDSDRPIKIKIEPDQQ